MDGTKQKTRRLSNRPVSNRAILGAGTVVLASALGLLAGELVIRQVGSVDRHGQFVFRGRAIRPYALPVARLQRLLSTRRRSIEQNYDSQLGWESWHDNALGARNRAPDLTPQPEKIRISIYGDSFVEGHGVAAEDAFPALLEAFAQQSGISQLESLNFGVGGYGMDQALLKFRKHVRMGARSQVVVFGFQPENMLRNFNLIRMFFHPTTRLPFSKPRFVLEDGKLILINVPTPHPTDLPDLMSDIETWPLLRYERFFDSNDYQRAWWQRSKLLAVLTDIVWGGAGRPTRPLRSPSFAEQSQLALAIITQFAREVRAVGAQFFVVFLPQRKEIDDLRSGKRNRVMDFESQLRPFGWIDTTEALLEVDPFKGGTTDHYGPAGNEAVARSVFRALQMAGVFGDTVKSEPGTQQRSN